LFQPLPQLDSGLEYRILRVLKTYYDVQKLRVATELRVKQTRFSLCQSRHMVPMAVSRDKCPICGAPVSEVVVEPPEALRSVLERLELIERDLYRELERVVVGHPLYAKYLQFVRGVGAATAAYLITVLNPARFEKVSQLWKYCGLHVENGKAPKRVSGQATGWNPVARTMMWRLGESFRKVGEFYKMMYQRFFEESTKKHQDWTKAHHLAHARRVAVKLFLAHWHTVGRALQGLPVRKPYICDKQPHQCVPPVLDAEDPAVIQSFYDMVLRPLGWWSEKEYYNWVTALKIFKQQQKQT
jgi:uncharacterized protein (UPF0212 family)